MQNIQYLLNQVGIIFKKNNEILDATGGRFNMFKVVGVNHYENTHSAILTEFLNPKGSHGLKHIFLQAFVDTVLANDQFKFNCENAIIKTEVPTRDGRIDILIEDVKQKQALIIENKIYANDQWKQLKRYNIHAKEKYGESNYKILYLTLDGSEATKQSGEGVEYLKISYSKEITGWLENSLNFSVRFPIVRETIIQYINHLKQLTNQDMNMKDSQEIVDLLIKQDNIESAFKISENIEELKRKLLTDMAKRIAVKCSTKEWISDNNKSISFSKENWQKQDTKIFFGEDKGRTYYAIKTVKALNGEAEPLKIIDELFDKNVDKWNPYGWGYINDTHWSKNSQLYIEMTPNSVLEEKIISYLQNVLAYLKEHSEIESEL